MRRMIPIALYLFVAFMILPCDSPATPPSPSYGAATVDGAHAEWNLLSDFFAHMYEAGNPTHPLKSEAYLRYDCRTTTLYVLVLTAPGVTGYHDPSSSSASSWVAVNGIQHKRVNDDSGNDGNPPDFAWVDPAYDGDPTHNHGFEASFVLAPGSYSIIVHTAIWTSAQGTSATAGSPGTGPALVIDCTLLGVCCAPGGACAMTTMADCIAPGVWHGEWSSCAPNDCPPPPGACCFADGHCELLTEVQCAASPDYVAWLGETEACTPSNPCPQPGACCDMATGACTFVLEQFCGTPLVYAGGACVPDNPCLRPGACCNPDTGACTFIVQANCPAGWTWMTDVSCEPNPCPPPITMGACCAPNGSCTMTTQEQCAAPSVWHPEYTTCTPNYCPPPVPVRPSTWGQIKGIYR